MNEQTAIVHAIEISKWAAAWWDTRMQGRAGALTLAVSVLSGFESRPPINNRRMDGTASYTAEL